MLIGSFGKKTFEVSTDKVNTFSEFSKEIAINLENQDADNSKPKTYIKGVDLDKISFVIMVSADLGVNPHKEFLEWESMINSLQPQRLIIGNKPIGKYKYLITNLKLNDTEYILDGKLYKARIEVSMQEFVKYGSKEDKAASTSTSNGSTATVKKSSSGSVTGINAGNPYEVKTKPPEQKSEQKRANSNMQRAIMNS